ncbi:MAG: YbjN domain-containing protein [Hyphomicrobiaceae bacterium]|nr:YbjN domain-containing protein [Hyphomicrobiaceae bacterium]
MQDPRPVVADIEFVADVLRLLGYQADVTTLSGGGQGLTSLASGVPFTAFLFKNDVGNSPYLMLSVLLPGHQPPLAQMNEWNNRFPMTRASLTREGEPMLTHAVLLTGIDTSHIRETMQWWDLLVRLFAQKILGEPGA